MIYLFQRSSRELLCSSWVENTEVKVTKRRHGHNSRMLHKNIHTHTHTEKNMLQKNTGTKTIPDDQA